MFDVYVSRDEDRSAPLPDLRRWIRADGASVTLWTARCHDCGFVTGLVRVRWPDGREVLLSGAGCYDRRGPEAAERWAEEVMPGLQTESR